MTKEAQKKIIFPLDVPDIRAAEEWVRKLNGLVGVFKVGLELFVGEGPAVLRMIQDQSSAGIFLDLKFHDIPATMEGALRSAAKFRPRLVTIHPNQGERLKQAVSAIQNEHTTVLGVTVLTSIAQSDLPKMGLREGLSMEDLVDLRVVQSLSAGCGGIVCSGLEVKRIRRNFGKDLILVAPGIRPIFSLEKEDDQERIATPRKAIQDGADYLVIGRPIRNAKDPVEALEKIAEEIADAFFE
jgi:orotidine-5'-phosphate decarboxylase